MIVGVGVGVDGAGSEAFGKDLHTGSPFLIPAIYWLLEHVMVTFSNGSAHLKLFPVHFRTLLEAQAPVYTVPSGGKSLPFACAVELIEPIAQKAISRMNRRFIFSTFHGCVDEQHQ